MRLHLHFFNVIFLPIINQWLSLEAVLQPVDLPTLKATIDDRLLQLAPYKQAMEDSHRIQIEINQKFGVGLADSDAGFVESLRAHKINQILYLACPGKLKPKLRPNLNHETSTEEGFEVIRQNCYDLPDLMAEFPPVRGRNPKLVVASNREHVIFAKTRGYVVPRTSWDSKNFQLRRLRIKPKSDYEPDKLFLSSSCKKRSYRNAAGPL